MAQGDLGSLKEIERSLRGNFNLVVPALERLLPSLGGADRIEALLVLGSWHVTAQTLDAAEAAARADRLMNEALALLPEQRPPA